MNRLASLGLILTFLLVSSLSYAVSPPSALVDVDWLAKHVDDVVILDVRANPKTFTSMPLYQKDKKTGKQTLMRVAGHIPGSRLIYYKDLRADKTIDGKKVQKMLLDKAAFEALMQKAGVNQNDAIVILNRGTGNADMTMATRLYWQLKYFGQDNMAILDGGLGAWLHAGHAVTAKAKPPAKGNWKATAERSEILATTGDVAKAVETKDAQLVDTRAISLYLGTWRKSSYVYDSGHIPGAKNFPNELLTQPGAPANFNDSSALKTLMTELGIDTDKPSITYCNSGHLASGSWFVMSELLGNKNTRLYDGSMHEWTLEKQPTVKMKIE